MALTFFAPLKTVRIADLPAVASITELPGGLFEVEVLTGPVAGAYVNKKLTLEQLLAYLHEGDRLISLSDAKQLLDDGAVATDKRFYTITGLWNGSTTSSSVVVQGLASNLFAPRGYLVPDPNSQGSNPAGQWVVVNVAAGTYSLPPSGITQAQLDAVATTLPLRPAQTGSYTLALADKGCLVPVASATAVTITVPDNASVPFPVGTILQVRQTGAGQLTLAGASGVVVNAYQNALKTAGQWAEVGLHKVDVNTWVLTGGVA